MDFSKGDECAIKASLRVIFETLLNIKLISRFPRTQGKKKKQRSYIALHCYPSNKVPPCLI